MVEVERFKKFQQTILGTKDEVKIKDVDIRNYAKYTLREGADIEKRELLGCFRNKILLNQKVVSIELSEIN